MSRTAPGGCAPHQEGGLSLGSPGLALCPAMPGSLLPPTGPSQADGGRCWKPGFLKENDRFSFSVIGSVHACVSFSLSLLASFLVSSAGTEGTHTSGPGASSPVLLQTLFPFIFSRPPHCSCQTLELIANSAPSQILAVSFCPPLHTHAEHGVPHTRSAWSSPPGDFSVVNGCTPVLTAHSTQARVPH